MAKGISRRWGCLALAGVVWALGACAGYTPYESVLVNEVSNLRRIDGHWVYVEDEGRGEPVLFLHGFAASTYSWRNVTPWLEDSYRVLALDLHGFGWTERPDSQLPYSREGQADLVLSVLDEMGIESAHLVGHSYGGAIAMTVASRAPERVRSLVLVDAVRPSYARERRYFGAAVPGVAEIVVRSVLRPRVVADGLRRAVVDDSVITDEVVGEYYDRLRVEGVAWAYEALSKRLSDDVPDPDLESLQVPTLVLWGSKDGSMDVEYGRSLASDVPNSRFEVIEQAGHMPMEERPDDVGREILEFLSGSRPIVRGEIARP